MWVVPPNNPHRFTLIHHARNQADADVRFRTHSQFERYFKRRHPSRSFHLSFPNRVNNPPSGRLRRPFLRAHDFDTTG